MLQRQVPTLKELVKRLPTARDIPSLTKDQAKQSLLESRRLLDATVQAVKQLHHWSLSVNFEATAALKQSRLNNKTHNKQINELMSKNWTSWPTTTANFQTGSSMQVSCTMELLLRSPIVEDLTPNGMSPATNATTPLIFSISL